MNRVTSTLLIAAFVAAMAGCSTNKQYIVSTTNGRMEVTMTQPQAVPGTDLYVYWDRVGNVQTMRRSDFAQVIER
ncbi:unnamed protein product [Phaeothamnion confervicola]